MKLNIIIIIKVLLSKANTDSPLAVSLSTKDKDEVKSLALLCILDISGSMASEPLDLVKESLKYFVKLMSDMDNYVLVTFSNNSQIVNT